MYTLTQFCHGLCTVVTTWTLNTAGVQLVTACQRPWSAICSLVFSGLTHITPIIPHQQTHLPPSWAELERAISSVSIPNAIVEATPILLTLTGSARASHRASLLQGLSNAQEHLDAFSRLVHKMTSIQNDLRHRVNYIQNALAPIFAIPPEILQRIFEETVLIAEHSTEAAKYMSHVCVHWRALALGTPSLWRNIYVPSTISMRKISDEFIDTCVQRSLSQPLNIAIRDTAPDRTHVLDLLDRVDIVSRLRALSVSQTSDDPDVCALDRLSDKVYPSLESLSLSLSCINPSEPYPLHLDHYPDSFTLSAPQLRSLSVRSVVPWNHLDISTLSSLDVAAMPYSLRMLQTMLRACTHLEMLSLSSIWESQHRLFGEEIDYGRVTFPHLIQLEMKCNDLSIQQLLYREIWAPNLLHIAFSNHDSKSFGNTARFVRVSFAGFMTLMLLIYALSLSH